MKVFVGAWMDEEEAGELTKLAVECGATRADVVRVALSQTLASMKDGGVWESSVRRQIREEAQRAVESLHRRAWETRRAERQRDAGYLLGEAAKKGVD